MMTDGRGGKMALLMLSKGRYKVVGSSKTGCKGDDNEYKCRHAYTVIKEYTLGGNTRNKKIYSERK
jgi:hypothetical protein